MRPFAAALMIAALCTGAFGQSVSDYLKLRKARHIVQPIGAQELDRLVGTKDVELQGLVQGSFKSNGSVELMLELVDNESIILQCPSGAPDWVLNGEVAVRALAKVSRPAPNGALTAGLIALAPEEPIQRIDEAYWHKEASKAPIKKGRSKTQLASRDAGELYGWIGRSHPHMVEEGPSDRIVRAYYDFVRKRNPKLDQAHAMEITLSLIRFSNHFGLDARLVVALLIVESDFDPTCTNGKSGAMGLGQLMPGTAAWMGVRDPYDSADNLYGAIKLLRTLLDEYMAQTGNAQEAVDLALAAYNAGEGAVKKYRGVPPYPETEAYVSRVGAIYARLCRK